MAQAQTLIEDTIDEIIDVTDPEPDYMYNSVFKVSDMPRGQHVVYRRAGLDRPSPRVVLQDLAPVNFKEGSKQTVDPLLWGAQFAVAKETIKDVADAGPHDGDTVAKLLDFSNFTSEMKHTAFWRVDTECADKLLNCTSTDTKYLGLDGLALASAAHLGLDNPQTSQSNLSTGAAFTPSVVMAGISAMNTQRDDRGNLMRAPKKWKVVTTEANRWKCDEIFDTEKAVYSAENQKNPLYKIRGDIERVIWNELGPTYTGWFILGEGHKLQWKWRDHPEFSKDSDFSANALKYGMTMRGVPFHDDWRKVICYPSS
ncbi:MAG: hypothetical protein WC538_22185 [Thermoanaerobaculia bacterium]